MCLKEIKCNPFFQWNSPHKKIAWRHVIQGEQNQIYSLNPPFLTSWGFAPLETISKPSLAMDLARTVAVVVPSPASSLVLLATSCTRRAPMFWYLSFSSMALATVTPSLVIFGPPKLCSIITFFPYRKKNSNKMLTQRSNITSLYQVAWK